MIAMVSNMSALQFSNSRPTAVKCNGCAVLCRVVVAGVVSFFAAFLPIPASGQTTSATEVLQSPPSDEHRALDTVKFLAGGAAGLAIHETGHLIFDTVFDAGPGLKGVTFGPLPFFAITHRGDVSPRREFAISSAGFWMQELSSEWLLTKRPGLRETSAPVAKGLLAFNVLNSVGYAFV